MMMIILNLRASLPKMPCANYKAWLSRLRSTLDERMERACILEGFLYMNYPAGWEAQTCVFHLFTTLKSGLPKKASIRR